MKIFSAIWRAKIPERMRCLLRCIVWGVIMTNFERVCRGFGLIKNEVLGVSEGPKSLWLECSQYHDQEWHKANKEGQTAPE